MSVSIHIAYNVLKKKLLASLQNNPDTLPIAKLNIT